MLVYIMVHLREQSIFCLEIHTRKSQIAPPDVTENARESVYGTHLRMLLKMDLRVKMIAKFGQLKNESKSEFLMHLVMHKKVQTEQ